jgi:hypothetical protein
MDFYRHGALTALQLFKVADILSSPAGRRLVKNLFQAAVDPEGKPRVVRTLEPYYEQYVQGDPDAFNRFDDRLHARMGQ